MNDITPKQSPDLQESSSQARRNKVRRGGRHLARELALHALYQSEISGDADIQRAIMQISEDHQEDEILDLDYFRRLAYQVWSRLVPIDQWIAKSLENWSLDRIAVIDRNILRLGIYELLEEPDLPVRVVINEAIELSKRYGGEGSSRFINGVLDRVAEQVRRDTTANPRQLGG